jgi:hypothetical protein
MAVAGISVCAIAGSVGFRVHFDAREPLFHAMRAAFSMPIAILCSRSGGSGCVRTSSSG